MNESSLQVRLKHAILAALMWPSVPLHSDALGDWENLIRDYHKVHDLQFDGDLVLAFKELWKAKMIELTNTLIPYSGNQADDEAFFHHGIFTAKITVLGSTAFLKLEEGKTQRQIE
jgi:hypothetical protein